MPRSIRIDVAAWDSPDGVRLRGAQRAELDARYGNTDHEPGSAPTADDITIFLVARDETGTALGCGGLRLLAPGSAEIKRMYVTPSARGTGVSISILRRLEAAAVRAGVTTLLLETGTEQPEAMRFYEREGYRRIPNFGPYQGCDLSACYSRTLRRPEVLVSPVERSDLPALKEVSDLLRAYLVETEREKQQHAGEPAGPDLPLPARYQREVDDPGQVFAGGTLLLARQNGLGIGVLAVIPVNRTTAEIKRLWVTPAARGIGAGSALVRTAMREATGAGRNVAQLTVWNWRTAALATYERLGFRTVASWDPRPDLVCLECTLTP